MNVISNSGLTKQLAGRPGDVAREVRKWYKIARKADWKGLADVQQQFPDADLVDGLLVFNIRHNRYRLVIRPAFFCKTLVVGELLTHKEYDKGDWKK